MELVYRVLWTDSQDDLFQAVEHAFQDWTGDVAHEVITVADEESQIREFRIKACLLYTSPSPRDKRQSRMPSSA